MTQIDRFNNLKKAFERDGFKVKDLNTIPSVKKTGYVKKEGFLEYQGRIGISAENPLAVVGRAVPKQEKVFKDEETYKKVYYLEGKPHEMGFLLGLMAEPEVSVMADTYVENVIPDFFDITFDPDSKIIQHIQEILVELLGEAAEKMEKDIPDELIMELEGIVNGCQVVNPDTEVELKALKFLNFGIDYLVSHIYTGEIFQQKKKKVPPEILKVPIMCNTISLTGDIVEGDKHFFGRDFMFPTAGVFQDVACLIIYNPIDCITRDHMNKIKEWLPLLSQTAPGFVGSIAALNREGVAMGVDMLPGSLCNPERPGLNSLLLVRYATHVSQDIYQVVDTVRNAQRGVTWLYPVADGKQKRACIIEAGANTGDAPFNYFKDIPKEYSKYLPDKEFFSEIQKKYKIKGPQKGMMVRWDDYFYPDEFIEDFNEKLWKAYHKNIRLKIFNLGMNFISFLIDCFGSVIKDIFKLPKIIWQFLNKICKIIFRKVPFREDYFSQYGFIDKTWRKRNCPGPFYFAPQRETSKNILIAGNHYITPEMRMTGMTDWITILEHEELDEFQWRYDEMNWIIHCYIKERGKINEEDAQDIIDFLRPTNGHRFCKICKEFYNPALKKDPRTIEIKGSVSLFELTEKKMRSHFGYYGDEWIEVNFSQYLKYL